jgi:hypothetical protein
MSETETSWWPAGTKVLCQGVPVVVMYNILTNDVRCPRCKVLRPASPEADGTHPLAPEVVTPGEAAAALGVKHDGKKPRWSLLPWKALGEVVAVLEYGAKKYAPDNWRIVPGAVARYKDAAQRHMAAILIGEDKDPETGLRHAAHAVCCLLYLLAFQRGDVPEVPE